MSRGMQPLSRENSGAHQAGRNVARSRQDPGKGPLAAVGAQSPRSSVEHRRGSGFHFTGRGGLEAGPRISLGRTVTLAK